MPSRGAAARYINLGTVPRKSTWERCHRDGATEGPACKEDPRWRFQFRFELPPMSVKVVLYSKPGCHLCDDVHAVLEQVRRERPYDLEVRDISKNRKLIEAYGLDIPVVTIDGAVAFRHRMTADELRAALQKGPD